MNDQYVDLLRASHDLTEAIENLLNLVDPVHLAEGTAAAGGTSAARQISQVHAHAEVLHNTAWRLRHLIPE